MRVAFIACLLLAGLGFSVGGLAQAPAQPPQSNAGIARAAAVEGTVFVTRLDGKQGILQRGSNLQRGETLNTTRNSSVRLRFTDGGETVVRPESSVVVTDYQFIQDAPAQDSLLIRLLKGGMRAVTGAVGKRGDINAYLSLIHI